MALTAGALGCGGLAAGEVHPYLHPSFERCVAARRLSTSVRVDGEADAAWAAVPEVSGFYADREKKTVRPLTHVRAAYDEKMIYFLLRCEEPPGYKYTTGKSRVEYSRAWRDDCVEMFIAPERGRPEFFQFIVSAAGAWGQNRSDTPWRCEWSAAAKTSNGGWSAEVAIPLAALRGETRDGSAWAVNFTRNRPGAKQRSTFAPVILGHKAVEHFQPLVFCGTRSKAGTDALCRKALERCRADHAEERELVRRSFGPVFRAAPDEIKLGEGARLTAGGAEYSVAEATNHRQRPPAHPFSYESYDRPEWKRLREGYDYDEYALAGKTELEVLMRLRDWVNRKIIYSRRPDPSNMDLFDLLEKALKQGKRFYCWHQSQIYSQFAGSLGFNCKVVGLPGHVTNEVWLDGFGKWAWMDSTHNVHFEKGGVPVSVVEMRREWWRNRFADLKLLQGVSRAEVFHSEKTGDLEGRRRNYKSYFWRDSKPAAQRFKYGWIYTVFANDFFRQKREHSAALKYLLRDPVVEEKMRAGGPGGAGAFAAALRKFGAGGVSDAYVSAEDFEWTLNTVTLHLYPSRTRGAVDVRLETFTPNFDRFVVTIDGKAPKAGAGGGSLLWRLHRGRNVLTARARNRFGREGRVSSVTLESR